MSQRVILSIIMTGFSIVTKAFVQAYQQAKAGGGSNVSNAVSSAKMSVEQARQILQLEAKGPLKKDEVLANFTKYYEANDPEKGGSFYVQSKIFNAKEALIDDMRKRAQAKREAAAGNASGSSSSSSSSSSTSYRNSMVDSREMRMYHFEQMEKPSVDFAHAKHFFDCNEHGKKSSLLRNM
jgi:mitochondrial import inner membrane translocase subunit TIM16